jgi:hypothetical protein
MALRKAGFFRELRHGDPVGPSLAHQRDRVAAPDRARIAQYLRGGSVLASTGKFVDDWFEASNVDIAPLDVRTDGTWVWPGDLPYYVERYGVALPEELHRHMANQEWSARELTQAELLAAEQSMFSEAQEE